VYLEYRESEQEKLRTQDLIKVVPKTRRTVLDIGARDGYFSSQLTAYYELVTALDLEQPKFSFDRVVNVKGDITHLEMPDDYFDVVFCAEVLEHIPALEKACNELKRVARHEVVIGVPYKQDTRCCRTWCKSCGKMSPPWGHINTFDEQRLRKLFYPLKPISTTYVGLSTTKTNELSRILYDFGRNPWGTYDQEEPCIHCGAKVVAPEDRSVPEKAASWLAFRLDQIQQRFVKPQPNWIHMVFQKRP
jgi:ubiquinone/menaquinone biosynthesis C-methylase UbiE